RRCCMNPHPGIIAVLGLFYDRRYWITQRDKSGTKAALYVVVAATKLGGQDASQIELLFRGYKTCYGSPGGSSNLVVISDQMVCGDGLPGGGFAEFRQRVQGLTLCLGHR